MLVVIQCAASKRSDAGHLRLKDGRRVMFVARPACVPRGDGTVYAHPDGDSDRGTSWRGVLREYNENHNPSPDNNPDGLLPAWQLYRPPVYKLLADPFRAGPALHPLGGMGVDPRRLPDTQLRHNLQFGSKRGELQA